MTLSPGPGVGQRALHGWLPMNPSQQPYEVGGPITHIWQMRKRRTEWLSHLPQVTQTRNGSSPARGRIRAIAAHLHHSHSQTVCHLHHSSWQCQIPDPLSKARDRTHIFMDTSRIYFHCTTTGTPKSLHFNQSPQEAHLLGPHLHSKKLINISAHSLDTIQKFS